MHRIDDVKENVGSFCFIGLAYIPEFECLPGQLTFSKLSFPSTSPRLVIGISKECLDGLIKGCALFK